MTSVTFYGKTHAVQVGSEIYVDGWEPWATKLESSDWDRADYYLPTQSGMVRNGPIKALACNVKITGRTPQQPFGRGGVDCVRVQIEFVREDEPSEIVRGWMRITFHGN